MKIIYNSDVNDILLSAVNEYEYLCNYPNFYIKNSLIPIVKKAAQAPNTNYDFFKDLNCDLLGELLNNIDYTYTKQYFKDIVWIISDLNFHLDNRFGFVDSDTLYLVITTKGLDARFNNDGKAIFDWLVRGINYYISTSLTSKMHIGYFSHNHKFFDYDFMFKVFHQLLTFEPDKACSTRWWEIQGTLFLSFAYSYIQKNAISDKTYHAQEVLDIFNDIIKDYNSNYSTLSFTPAIGMCFNSGWITDLQINFENEISDEIQESLKTVIYEHYDEEIVKNIVCTSNLDQKSSQYIGIEKSNEFNGLTFELREFNKFGFVLKIYYSSEKDLLKLQNVLKNISLTDKTFISV